MVSVPTQLQLGSPVIVDVTSPSRDLKSFVTQQLRIILENRSVRFGVVGALLVTSSLLALVPTPMGVDYGWMFILPVAISAIAAGLSEGLFVALAASALCGLYVGATHDFNPALVAGVVSARFALYGITAAFLGAFAEAHHSVQTSLRNLAAMDPLTRVANVSSFYDQIATLEKEKTPFAVLVVDVDDLKKINDAHGHQAGTAAIQLVASALRRVVRVSDQVARYGGDEFVVLLRDADLAGCQIVMNRMREVLAVERLASFPGVTVSVSVGAALYGRDGSTTEELLASADLAMYTDKRSHKSGRGRSRELVLG